MATKKVYFGSSGPFLYDDTAALNDPDGDFAGENVQSLITDGQIYLPMMPMAMDQVVRLRDLGGILAPVDNNAANALSLSEQNKRSYNRTRALLSNLAGTTESYATSIKGAAQSSSDYLKRYFRRLQTMVWAILTIFLIQHNIDGTHEKLDVGAGDADGDTYVRSGGVLVRLAKGAAGTRFQMDAAGALPEWSMIDTVWPMFRAALILQSNVTGDGTIVNLTGAIWTEIVDQAGNFANGTFTAPVAGNYCFHITSSIAGLLAAHTYFGLLLITTSETIWLDYSNPQPVQSSGTLAKTHSKIINLALNDTVYIRLLVSNGTKVVDLSTTNEFSGFLIC